MRAYSTVSVLCCYRLFASLLILLHAHHHPGVRAQPDYDAHATDTVADWQRCAQDADCTWVQEGTTCRDKQCVPNNRQSVTRTFNLQLYQWSIESKLFARGGDAAQQCGNKWLNFYNACSNNGFFPGGIGHCGNWGSTVERIGICADSEDNPVSDDIKDEFCKCMCSTIIPAATATAEDSFYYRNQRCDSDVPTFQSAGVDILRLVCPYLNVNNCSDNLSVQSAGGRAQIALSHVLVVGFLAAMLTFLVTPASALSLLSS
jgi:hypothetical protein